MIMMNGKSFISFVLFWHGVYVSECVHHIVSFKLRLIIIVRDFVCKYFGKNYEKRKTSRYQKITETKKM